MTFDWEINVYQGMIKNVLWLKYVMESDHTNKRKYIGYVCEQGINNVLLWKQSYWTSAE